MFAYRDSIWCKLFYTTNKTKGQSSKEQTQNTHSYEAICSLVRFHYKKIAFFAPTSKDQKQEYAYKT